MLDEETARSLEQEAIALVNLSNSSQFAPKTSSPKSATELRTPSDVALEVYASSTVSKPEEDPTIKMEDGSNTKEDTELIDGNISMKSLLVTLKKRKLHHSEVEREDEGEDDTLAKQLPSFRAVFQPQPQVPLAPAEARSHSGASADGTTTTTAVTAELKCKYRTGKCHNRKLDRKKKEQRMQQQQLTADALASNESSPTSQKQPTMASSHAAAAALASLVAAQPQHQFDMLQQRQFFASGVAMQDAAMGEDRRNRSTSATSCVRPKQEDACSY
ncbi:hypothetical protein BBJ29_008493 [Phytophthora kernoviae]|uniref:Uncharacterized protein n=1 Tax=Phytophthora kernoviae TaxID=325452 RepID=A0A3F2RLN2_9STRA|nr:hypothetical protein BBJ29_008493 [Phytophthora kernoviae]RLN60029.1 hypothetical protein BBP00_00006203 [Phytophthora kernoviae]